MGRYTLLDDDDILIVQRTLAKAIGLNRSIVLRQIHFWIDLNEKSENEQVHHDGRWWTFATYERWQEKSFDFWSYHTIRRMLVDLEGMELTITESDKYNKRKNDYTKWYTIDYEKYAAFIELWQECGSPVCGDGTWSDDYTVFMDRWREKLSLGKFLVGLINLISPAYQVDKRSLMIPIYDTKEKESADPPARLPSAAVKQEPKPEPVLGIRPSASTGDNVQKDDESAVKPAKLKVQPELARKIASIYNNARIAKAKLPLIEDECKLYDSDPIFKDYIETVFLPQCTFEKSDRKFRKKLDDVLILLKAKADWPQFQKSRESDSHFTDAESVASLF